MTRPPRPEGSPTGWLSDDLTKMIGLPRLARFVRREPTVLIWPLLSAGIALIVIAVVLRAFGRLDLYAYGLVPAALIGSGALERRVRRRPLRYPRQK